MQRTHELAGFIVIIVELFGPDERVIKEEIGQAAEELMRNRCSFSERSRHLHRRELFTFYTR
jgi:hypothetical protein